MSSRLVEITANATLVTEECYRCGVLFAMPKEMQKRRLEDHKDFYCPAGHGQHYVGKTEEQKLRDRLAAEEQRRERAEARERVARRHAEHEASRANGYKGQMVKAKKKLTRVAAGVCPECNRTFQNLARHMAHQHGPAGEA